MGAVIGLAIVLVLICRDEGKLPDWHWPPLNGFFLLPLLYVAIAVHESGYLLAGKWAGFELGGISVGPFVLVRSGDHWTFEFERRRWAGGFYKPLTDKAGMNISRYAWMTAGGPLANLLLAGDLLGDGIFHGQRYLELDQLAILDIVVLGRAVGCSLHCWLEQD